MPIDESSNSNTFHRISHDIHAPAGSDSPITTQTEPQNQPLEELPIDNVNHLSSQNHEEADEHIIHPDSLATHTVEKVAEIPTKGDAIIDIRKSTRHFRPPIWLKDYMTIGKFTDNKYQSYLKTFSTYTEPDSFKEAAQDSRWVEAMQQEINVLEENNTWKLVDLPLEKHVIGSKWQKDGICIKWMSTMPSYKATYMKKSIWPYHKDFIDMGKESKRQGSDMVIILVYIDDLLITEKVGLSGSKPVSTYLELNQKLTTIEYDAHVGRIGDLKFDDITAYQKLIGKLLYLTITRPDISFAVQTLSQFKQSPKQSHMDVTLRVVKYIVGAPDLGVLLQAKPIDSFVST
uniref:Uncharacterized protein LOC104232483 n=1 Tax=Nicotiana sylvestris TaxID=4096 RepID=A0A1U7WVT3_NICSY|nr:PREDICTED: uncharacterized protein LOC104232483 [Nicotiana sylvestris]